MKDRTTLINERKKISTAYIGWQDACKLRDAVIMEVGSDNVHYRRAVDLVKVWYGRWKKEIDQIQPPISGVLVNRLIQAEKECDAWTPDDGE